MKTEQETHFLIRKIMENSSVWKYYKLPICLLQSDTSKSKSKKKTSESSTSLQMYKKMEVPHQWQCTESVSQTERRKKLLPAHKENISCGNCSSRPSKTKLKTSTDLHKCNLKSSKTS